MIGEEAEDGAAVSDVAGGEKVIPGNAEVSALPQESVKAPIKVSDDAVDRMGPVRGKKVEGGKDAADVKKKMDGRLEALMKMYTDSRTQSTEETDEETT